MDFYLYRVKVRFDEQALPFDDQRLQPGEILKRTILARPSMETGRNLIWGVGNVESVSVSSLFFQVGRTTRSILPDRVDGDFIDRESATWPHAPILLDYHKQIVGIGYRYSLGKTDTVAKKLGKLLSCATLAMEQGSLIELTEIPDPDEFVSQLQQAANISKFWYSLSRPNPADDHEDYYQPFQKTVEKLKGKKGKVVIDGDGIDPDPCVDIARAAASTGGDAGAVISQDGKEKVHKRLRGNKVSVATAFPPEDNEHRVTLWHKMIQKYYDIRGEAVG